MITIPVAVMKTAATANIMAVTVIVRAGIMTTVGCMHNHRCCYIYIVVPPVPAMGVMAVVPPGASLGGSAE